MLINFYRLVKNFEIKMYFQKFEKCSVSETNKIIFQLHKRVVRVACKFNKAYFDCLA